MRYSKFVSGIWLLSVVLSCNENRAENSEVSQLSKKQAIVVDRFRNPVIDGWPFEQVKGSVLLFKNGKRFDTKIFETKYIGQINNGKKAPFLLFTGRGCEECDANISLYIQSPDDPYNSEKSNAEHFDLPGTERDFENNTLIYKGTAFYGQVLPDTKGAIWYQENILQDGSWEKSTYVLSINNGVKKEKSIKGWADMSKTIKLLKQGYCTKIANHNYTSEP